MDGAGRRKMWSFLKKIFPKITPGVPTGKKDRNGKIITNHLGLKKLYLETYLHRLRNRPIKPDFEELKYLKDNLFDMRLENSRKRKSRPGIWLSSEISPRFYKTS